MKYLIRIIVLVFILFGACSRSEDPKPEGPGQLTIFFVNDVHGQLDKFAKVKHIVDQERKQTNVIVACSGDIFSGNPVVDNAVEKGAPMVDVMNRIGLDVAVLGNHEFDYGTDVLRDRFEQATFEWICANVDNGTTNLPQPKSYLTLNVGGMKITFLGLVETNGKRFGTIPSAHPWKMEGLIFTRPENVINDFTSLKRNESADLLIALSHLGYSGNDEIMGDVQLAQNYNWFDLIIGGHSHQERNEVVNGTPVFQAGSYLHKLGKINLTIEDKRVVNYSFELIDLDNYLQRDEELMAVIDEYNNLPYLNDVIGNSQSDLSGSEVGCFYCDALRSVMNTDIAFQNTGGVRAALHAGEITKREIFEISPFNNGTVIYEMTVGEIKNFLRNSGSGFYYSGVSISKSGSDIVIRDKNNAVIPDAYILTVGINDYIPAVHELYFPSEGNRQLLTAAETLIYYLENINSTIDYQGSNCYFRY
jgi:5'-nucleotidase/UDP-sugar diphosphatase